MTIDRREFLGRGLAACAFTGAAPLARRDDRSVLGVMGVHGRGTALARGFAQLDGVHVGHVCDVDARAIQKAIAAVKPHQEQEPRAVTDFRRILDDAEVDALVVAAPDHWHAPAAILACAAEKHVYLEKPCSHNPREGELLVEAARKFGRVVQHGTQRRSRPKIVEAIAAVRGGAIGRSYYARAWYANGRGSIGRGKATSEPEWLDWELWQGPAPRRPFRDNVVHYDWHWFWHWGTGELGNNGVHMLDLCRWGLAVDHPTRVTSSGGRYAFDDDQQTPDTHVVTFEFGARGQITWEGLSCNRRGPDGSNVGVSFHGDDGALVISGGGWRQYDARGKEVRAEQDESDDAEHLRDFVAAIRGDKAPNAGVADAHASTLLSHLGNIAHRTGHPLRCDPESGRIRGDAAASALWSRDYETGWEPRL